MRSASHRTTQNISQILSSDCFEVAQSVSPDYFGLGLITAVDSFAKVYDHYSSPRSSSSLLLEEGNNTPANDPTQITTKSLHYSECYYTSRLLIGGLSGLLSFTCFTGAVIDHALPRVSCASNWIMTGLHGAETLRYNCQISALDSRRATGRAEGRVERNTKMSANGNIELAKIKTDRNFSAARTMCWSAIAIASTLSLPSRSSTASCKLLTLSGLTALFITGIYKYYLTKKRECRE